MSFSLRPAEAEFYSNDSFINIPPGKLQEVWTAMDFERRWPHFSPLELCCKGTGALLVHYQTMDCLQRLRWAYKGPIVISSYYRTLEYNAHVGGSPNSYHMQGRAIDTPTLNGNAPGLMKLVHLATKAGFTGFGCYDTFTHIDTGPMRFW